MKSLNRFVASMSLTLVLGLSAVAGEVQSPPCPSPDPGEMSAPPCSTAQETSDDPTPGQTSTPPNGSLVTEYVVADTAIDFVESVLSLF
jgi:hypothetical protein